MTKVEMASYLAYLLEIDNYLDDQGASHPALSREYGRVFKLLTEEIEKDEARSSEQKRPSKPKG